MGYLEATRAGYDATAAAYAERFHDHLDAKPVDRATLAAFAELVLGTGHRAVVDVGCGTGATTAILRNHGTIPTGIDLSPNMIVEARHRNPDLAFRVGSMLHLDLADQSVAGVCAWYSIIHVPDADLPQAWAEFRRVLVGGGVLLVAFQVGDGTRRLTEAWGAPVDLVFHRRSPDAIIASLVSAGFLPPCAAGPRTRRRWRRIRPAGVRDRPVHFGSHRGLTVCPHRGQGKLNR